MGSLTTCSGQFLLSTHSDQIIKLIQTYWRYGRKHVNRLILNELDRKIYAPQDKNNDTGLDQIDLYKERSGREEGKVIS